MGRVARLGARIKTDSLGRAQEGDRVADTLPRARDPGRPGGPPVTRGVWGGTLVVARPQALDPLGPGVTSLTRGGGCAPIVPQVGCIASSTLARARLAWHRRKVVLYSRQQLLVLLALVATFGGGLAVERWRRAHPETVERLERFDRTGTEEIAASPDGRQARTPPRPPKLRADESIHEQQPSDRSQPGNPRGVDSPARHRTRAGDTDHRGAQRAGLRIRGGSSASAGPRRIEARAHATIRHHRRPVSHLCGSRSPWLRWLWPWLRELPLPRSRQCGSPGAGGDLGRSLRL